MPKCIFCLQEKERLTDEHVFPAVLGGGTFVLKNSVCVQCNNSFSKFEQPLAMELSPIRLLLKIPDRYGALPQVAATIKTSDNEYKGRVERDGQVKLKPIVREVEAINGGREIVYQFPTDKQREKLRQEAGEKGFQLSETGPGDPQQGEVHVGGDVKLIGSAEGLRTTSKIAYVGLAQCASATLATSDSFDEVRAYVCNGTGEPTSRLFVHKRFLNSVQQGPHQHSLIIAGRNDKRRVDAIVRLFGALCYFVTLSDHYAGADFFCTLVYDAQRGEVNGFLQTRVDAEILQTEDVRTSDETIWDDLVASGESFCNFLNDEIRSYLKRTQGQRGGDDGRSCE